MSRTLNEKISYNGRSYEGARCVKPISRSVNAMAFIWSTSLIQIHANIDRGGPQNQDLWMSSCGNCVNASSNFPQSDSGNKSSMSNFLKFFFI